MPFNITPPKDDDAYFEKMCRAIFQAGLNWTMIENKWPNFRKAFSNFSIQKVAKYGDKEIDVLMNNTGIVRNQKKIRSVIHNAKEFEKIQKEYNSFPKYISSFRGAYEGLSYDMQERFKHLGPSSARMYMWMIGLKLNPTEEEKKWISAHEHDKDFKTG